MGYFGNFMVYTMAMVGVIVVALLIYKNSTGIGVSKKSKYLKVIDTMSIAPRKTLYIVSAGQEKFLIAGDVDKTTLISKLEKPIQQPDELIDVINGKENSFAKEKYNFSNSKIGITSSMMDKNDKFSIKDFSKI